MRVVVRAACGLPLLFVPQMAWGQTSGLPAPMSGDCVTSAAGVVTCAKTGGVVFAPSATVDATNGSNVTSGTVAAARVATLNQNTTGTAVNVTGVVLPANGGTGVMTLTGIRKANGTSADTAAGVADFPTLNQNTTGTAVNVTGVVLPANGGTGASSLTGLRKANGVSADTVGVAADIAAALGYTPGVSAAIPGTPNALYTFTQATGATGGTIPDASGSGNPCTIGSTAPTFNGLGAYFGINASCAMPAALNSDRSFAFAFYKDPLNQGQQTANNYPYMQTSSTGPSGYNIGVANYYGVNNIGAGAWIYRPGALNQSSTTACSNAISGWHTLVMTYGNNASTDKDHLYLDGVECALYLSQGTNSGSQTGNMFLGAANSPWTGSGLLGSMYMYGAWSAELTAAQALQFDTSARLQVAARGVQTSPQKLVQATPVLYAIGDSLTCGTNTPGQCANNAETAGTTAWPSQLALTNQSAWSVRSDGIAGITLASVNGSETNRVATRCTSSAGNTAAIIFLGINDITSAAMTTAVLQAQWDTAVAEMRTLRNAGCAPIFIATLLSNSAKDANREAYNAILYREAKSSGFEGIVDFSSLPGIGQDGAAFSASATANASVAVTGGFASIYFATNTASCAGNAWDGTHPNCLGQTAMAATASRALNAYYGSTEAAPTVVTASTYTMLSGDTYVSAQPTAAQAYTLPLCNGPTGAIYRINNSQSTYAVTVIGNNTAQTINGQTTAVTVNSLATIALRVAANAATTGGCHWEY